MQVKKMLLFALVVASLAVMLNVAHAQGGTGQAAGQQIQSQTSGCGLLPQDIAAEISTSQPWYCPINQQIYTEWKGYIPIASIAVMLGFMIGSVIFMFGLGFKNDKIRNFGIGEIYEAMASGIVVGAFLYISAVMFGILPGSLVGAINPYATAFYQIQQTIQGAQATFTSLYNIYVPLQFLTSITQSVEIVGSYALPVNTASQALGYITQLGKIPITIFFIDPINAIGSFLADGIALLYSEYYILAFLASSAIPTFLAPGVVFRAIAPTRALGGMMISIGLAFFIVTPSLFAIVYYFTGPTLQQQLNLAAANAGKFSTSTINAQLGSLGPTNPLVLRLSQVQQAMSSFWLQILFYPSLIIAMTYAFINQASQFLGGAVKPMAGRLRSFV
ncbi:MAG: hypothetical protein KGH60_00270 [Candidatus Micrarchaeota archaeon]|nr:hypothetical protein [Candidatus Micrarchaeota archaeon]